MAKPLIPIPSDTLERTSQQRAVPETLFAPVPEAPKPGEVHADPSRKRSGTQPRVLGRRISRKGISSVTFKPPHSLVSSSESSVQSEYSLAIESSAGAKNKGCDVARETNVTS